MYNVKDFHGITILPSLHGNIRNRAPEPTLAHKVVTDAYHEITVGPIYNKRLHMISGMSSIFDINKLRDLQAFPKYLNQWETYTLSLLLHDADDRVYLFLDYLVERHIFELKAIMKDTTEIFSATATDLQQEQVLVSCYEKFRVYKNINQFAAAIDRITYNTKTQEMCNLYTQVSENFPSKMHTWLMNIGASPTSMDLNDMMTVFKNFRGKSRIPTSPSSLDVFNEDDEYDVLGILFEYRNKKASASSSGGGSGSGGSGGGGGGGSGGGIGGGGSGGGSGGGGGGSGSSSASPLPVLSAASTAASTATTVMPSAPKVVPVIPVIPVSPTVLPAAATPADAPATQETEKVDNDPRLLIDVPEYKEKFQKYFQMLKSGVPAGAVTNKMRQDGIQMPASFVLSESSTVGMLNAKDKPKTALIKPLFILSTIAAPNAPAWSNNAVQFTHNVDFSTMLTPQPEIVASKSTVKQPAAPKSIFDPQRAQKLSIALRNLNKKFTNENILENIRGVASAGQLLSYEDLNVLYQNKFWPSAEEAQQLKAIPEPRDVSFERLLYVMNKDIPDAEKRIKAMLFKYKLSEDITDISTKLQRFIDLCNAVMQNQEMVVLLCGLVIAINTLNHSNPSTSKDIPPIRGIRFQDLTSTGPIYSTNGNRKVLMPFLVKLIQANNHEVNGVIGKLIEAIEALLKLEYETLNMVIGAIHVGYNETKTQMDVVFTSSTLPQEIDAMDQIYKNAETLYQNGLAKFGQDPTLSVTDCFSALLTFLQKYQAAMMQAAASQKTKR